MSSVADTADADEPGICEWCGGVIHEEGQRCPALEDGRCRA